MQYFHADPISPTQCWHVCRRWRIWWWNKCSNTFFADIFSALKGDKHCNALGNGFVGKMIYLLWEAKLPHFVEMNKKYVASFSQLLQCCKIDANKAGLLQYFWACSTAEIVYWKWKVIRYRFCRVKAWNMTWRQGFYDFMIYPFPPWYFYDTRWPPKG